MPPQKSVVFSCNKHCVSVQHCVFCVKKDNSQYRVKLNLQQTVFLDMAFLYSYTLCCTFCAQSEKISPCHLLHPGRANTHIRRHSVRLSCVAGGNGIFSICCGKITTCRTLLVPAKHEYKILDFKGSVHPNYTKTSFLWYF